MNEVVKMFLLGGDKFMPEMHLRQPYFHTVLQNNLLKTERIQKFQETGIFRRTTSDKLHGKAFNIAKNPKYDGFRRGIVSMVCKFF